MYKLEESVFGINIVLRYDSTILMLGRFMSLVERCCWACGSLDGDGGNEGSSFYVSL